MTALTRIMTKAAEGGYGEDSGVIGKLAEAKFDRSWGPFLCGTMGAMGPDGLHDGYLICPTYGADAQCTAHFSRAKIRQRPPKPPAPAALEEAERDEGRVYTGKGAGIIAAMLHEED